MTADPGRSSVNTRARELLREVLSLFPAGTFLLAMAAVVCSLAPFFSRLFLDIRSGLESGEPWRPLTGHLVHGNETHLLSNLAFFIPLAFLRERRRGVSTFLAEFLLLALVVAAGVRALHPDWTSYCGLSGIVYGLLVLVILDETAFRGSGSGRPRLSGLGVAAVGILAAKSFLELSAGGWLFRAEALERALGVVYLPGSHCAGILAALALIFVQEQTFHLPSGRLHPSPRDRVLLSGGP